ncbi:hypothetical protein TBLA_0B04090 [Henningerozyma blattae CBS 6284]|uniref:Histone H1 n=1 Tax=Henningerozyma blattae (strain ATCC 34711 / CBS 6284 / DSM 70876 / NBRC 10599 / NRRL Y-10934 / UCD 77-7) TaxID=1071380 RepID=I2GYP5_HENB6|nr:hypothetical protein TBLA_0B04090 [Tetrapisispora blattae CBS 6284]CCH59247.1 hypothetical protein TBLA_0B04090 [Tetrapisispora blattae CBS 6284]
MPPKKATTSTATKPKPAKTEYSANANPKKKEDHQKSYKELITEALISLKETRKGSSRQSLKKYIKENYPKIGSAPNFDVYFNNAVKKGVETEDFMQPKGPSGPLKLAKKEPSPSSTPKKEATSTTTTSIVTTPVESKLKVKATKAVTDKKVSKKSSSSSSTTASTTTSSDKKITKKSTSIAASKEKSKSKSQKPKSKPSSSSSSSTPTYKDMIIKAIQSTNNGKGSSRTALKKYIKDNYSNVSSTHFDNLFNSAVRKGVESGVLAQPKGPSGVIKIQKKTAKVSAK